MKYPFHVFKFGGASVRNAAAIRNVATIVEPYRDKRLVVVVSAMGKTTNALERVVAGLRTGADVSSEIKGLKEYHAGVMEELFPKDHPIREEVDRELTNLPQLWSADLLPDQFYDQVVCRGELISTRIVAAYLAETGLPVEWIDARNYIKTDNTYREGKVDWDLTEKKIRELMPRLDSRILITQGFIGGTPDGFTTTLGREGSDYTAAIFGSCLGAENVTIWKDVPGVMNADPKRLPEAIPFPELPFREAAEMTYYGASVIHPKTIKPLANRGIPLLVKNFDDPALPGTRIHETHIDRLPPLIVFKENQCLISCAVTDYTFVDEEQLSLIFSAVSQENLKINLMQNSAISFSFCVDFREDKVLRLIERLSEHFRVYYNTGITLITVKNYDEATYAKYRGLPGVILEQSSRSTLQVLVKG
ncbi:MAG: aspartate kinase [Cyclobacteriaceae bacterium]|nr:aspartate kinase [Cyclobacteriaceae bacterium]